MYNRKGRIAMQTPGQEIDSFSASPVDGKIYTFSNGSQDKSSFSTKYHKRKSVFKVYPNCVLFIPEKKHTELQTYSHTSRGCIHTFSKRARFRLFQCLAMLEPDPEIKPIFVTLTYHEGFRSEPDKYSVDCHAWLSSLRSYDDGVAYIWRLEFQRRGAPHFHFIIFPSAFINAVGADSYKQYLSKSWHRLADPTSLAHSKYGCKIVDIKNYAMACSYLSKYCAKVDREVEFFTHGKQWGCSRNLPVKIISDIEMNKERASIVIEKLRRWLFKNGRSQYASDLFFNSSRPQVIFITPEEFEDLYNDANKSLVYDFKCRPDL